MLRYLVETYNGKSILAVDADANANLNEALGLELEETISQIMDEAKDARAIPAGVSKDQYIELRANQAIVESDNIDLLVMGNPKGPGCYCFPNELMRNFIQKLRTNYDYVAVDNEAGMEHLSRKTIDNVDYLLITSDATARGVRSAGRVYDIVKSVKIDARKIFLVVNRTDNNGLESLKGEIEKTGLELIGGLPNDERVYEYDLKGRPLFDLPQDSRSYLAAVEIGRKLGL